MRVRLPIPAMLRCCERRVPDDLLEDFALNLLSPEQAANIQRHCTACSQCGEELASVLRRTDLIRTILADESQPTLAPARIGYQQTTTELCIATPHARVAAASGMGLLTSMLARTFAPSLTCAAAALMIAAIGLEQPELVLPDVSATEGSLIARQSRPAGTVSGAEFYDSAGQPMMDAFLTPAPKTLPARRKTELEAKQATPEPPHFYPSSRTARPLPPTIVLAAVAPPQLPIPHRLDANTFHLVSVDFPDVAPPKHSLMHRIGSTVVWPFRKLHGSDARDSKHSSST